MSITLLREMISVHLLPGNQYALNAQAGAGEGKVINSCPYGAPGKRKL